MRKKGFTMLDTIIGLFIFSMMLTTFMTIASTQYRMNKKAIQLAQLDADVGTVVETLQTIKPWSAVTSTTVSTNYNTTYTVSNYIANTGFDTEQLTIKFSNNGIEDSIVTERSVYY